VQSDSPLTVMLIDDCEIDNMIHQRNIRKTKLPCDVMVEETADQALQALRERLTNEDSLPSFIFLDLNLPGTNGWEFVEELASLFSDSSRLFPKVIMLTTSMNPLERQRAEDHPLIYSFANKPLKPEGFTSYFLGL
tara:strand:- start:34015 stop:34422 length:408 start_codon:yes stop_codon:yes gene_type:complete